MIVLGISPLDKDSTVSLVKDGEVIFAAGEERFTRKKIQDGFPLNALQEALDWTGTRLQDIDVVAYPFFSWERETELFTKNIEAERQYLNETPSRQFSEQISTALNKVPERSYAIPGLSNPNAKMEKRPDYKLFYKLAGSEGVISRNLARRGSQNWRQGASAYHKIWHDDLEANLQELGLLDKLKRFDHHLAHSANAYYASGFEKALVVTLDGYGSGLAGSICVAEGNELKRIHELEFPHSLGTFYESVTSSLGFTPGRHEGKIVGLAAYGDPDILLDLLLSRFDQGAGNFRILEVNNIFFSRNLATIFPKIDIAAAYQKALEVVAANYIKFYVEKTGIDTVVMSGGVIANVKLNQRVFEIPGVEQIYVYPNMGDGGAGTGAAFLASREYMAGRKAYESTYFGSDYSDDVIAEELNLAGLEFERFNPIEPEIASLIHAGRVVARFNGRMEYGPRALGNRSILYKATDPEVNQWLNQRLGRTEFMPFAPATLFEERHTCFENTDGATKSAQYMTITFNCTDFMKNRCPAAVHVDGTARPQLVKEDVNPSFYNIIKEYYKLSEIPSIINTSFNMHEEPIVNTPADAIRAFLQGNLDYLAISNFLVKHPSQKQS